MVITPEALGPDSAHGRYQNRDLTGLFLCTMIDLTPRSGPKLKPYWLLEAAPPRPLREVGSLNFFVAGGQLKKKL